MIIIYANLYNVCLVAFPLDNSSLIIAYISVAHGDDGLKTDGDTSFHQ